MLRWRKFNGYVWSCTVPTAGNGPVIELARDLTRRLPADVTVQLFQPPAMMDDNDELLPLDVLYLAVQFSVSVKRFSRHAETVRDDVQRQLHESSFFFSLVGRKQGALLYRRLNYSVELGKQLSQWRRLGAERFDRTFGIRLH